PYLAEQAARLATQLIIELAGATWVGATDVQGMLPERPVIRLRPERTDQLIGVVTRPVEQIHILERLGFEVGAGLTVVVPTWRARDVTREADLIEEVARFRLDEVPFTLPRRSVMFGRLTKEQRLRRTVEEVLVGCGLTEAYTASLVAADPREDAIRVPLPLSTELSVLRTTLVPSLIDVARRNLDAGNTRVALFEIARVYLPAGEGQLTDERWHVGAVLEGSFERAKGVVETLYRALHAEARFEPAQEALFHPGKTARLGAGIVG